ncbi:MAG TPA: ABC transporter substrate-binding protein [Actinomycetota bacterium]|nr:ABC transporter substrate-binding protein [Actinomycetota bacterium]
MIAARARCAGALLVAALAACTGPDTSTLPGDRPQEEQPSAPPITVPVIVPTGSEIAGPLLDAMRVAMDDAAEEGVALQLDLRETADPAAELVATVQGRPPAVFVLGDGQAVVGLRTEIEASRVPVIVVGDDLYSSRSLFRYAFQTSIPLWWQARVLATYLLEDRGERNVTVLVPDDGEATVAEAAFGAAFSEEAGIPPTVAVVSPESGPAGNRRAITGAEAVIALGPPGHAAAVGNLLGQSADPARLVIGSSSLSHLIGPQAPPGTAVVYPYTWAGWADMIPRVHSFRERFMAEYARPPTGPEQEGYDAVMAIAEALRTTGGRGGDALVRVLESFRDQTYSALPIRLGPDDHVFAEQSQLGLFAVEAPGAAAPGEALGAVPWRPIMRTFTTDGEKVNLLDRDKKVFFPFWHEKRPSPKYWRSRYGIVSRPTDPLH